MSLYDDIKASVQAYCNDNQIVLDRTSLLEETLTTFFIKVSPLLLKTSQKLYIANEAYQTLLSLDHNEEHFHTLRSSVLSIEYMQKSALLEIVAAQVKSNEYEELTICKKLLTTGNVLLITQDLAVKEKAMHLNTENYGYQIDVKMFNSEGVLTTF